MDQNPDDCIIGKKVIVKFCPLPKHGDIEGCVCHFIGRIVRIGKKSDTVPFAYEIASGTERKHCVRRDQVTLMPDHPMLRRKK